MATYENNSPDKFVAGSNGNDRIQNFGAVISYYNEDDEWEGDEVLSPDNSTIDAGKGNDYIFNDAENVSINGGDGADTIENFEGDAESDGGDYYNFVPNGAIIDGGKGNDLIENNGDKVTIDGGDDNDVINNYLSDNSFGSEVSINGGKGDDTISNEGTDVTIEGGAGNDLIENSGDNVTISGGEGDDSISNEGADVIIEGGAGNNRIENSGDNVLFKYTGGNDFIGGFDESSTLQIMSGTVDKVKMVGSNFVLTLGENSVTLENAADLETLNVIDKDGNEIELPAIEFEGTDGDDNISVNISNTVVRAGKGNNNIESTGNNVSISCGDGNNNIFGSGENSVIETGNGNNFIDYTGTGCKIILGSGSDTVSTTSNDNDRNFISTGDGKDSVNTNGSNSTVDLGSDGDYYYGCPNTRNNSINGGEGDDTIDSNGPNVTIDGGEGEDILNNYGEGSNVNGGGGDDTIESDAPNSTLDGGGDNDVINNYGGNSEVNGGEGEDTLNNYGEGSKVNGGGDNDLIYSAPDEDYYYYDDEAVANQMYDFEDGVFELGAEYIDFYDESTSAVKEALEKFLNNPSDEYPSAITKEIQKYIANHMDDTENYFGKVKGANDIAGYIEQLGDGIKLLTDLNQSHPIVNLDDYSKAVTGFERSLDDYLDRWDDLPRSEVRKILDDWYPDVDNYTEHYSKMDKLNDIRKSNASFGNKVNKIGELIDTDTSFNLKNAWRNAGKLEKAGAVMSIADVGINAYESRDEISNAWNDAKEADLLDKWHVFQESFKAQDSKKYDNFNLSVIDATGTGVGLLVGGAATAGAIALGAPVALAGFFIAGTVAVGTAAVKTCYSVSQHKDASVVKTFFKHLNPLDPFFDKSGSTYSPKNLEEYSADGTILGGDGNDTLLNDNLGGIIISGEEGEDAIVNQSSENVMIFGGAGKDSINNVNSSNVTINGDAGDDLISNWADSVEIFGGAGNNTIRNFDSTEIFMSALDGDDYIDNAGDLNFIDAGDGNNLVDNVGAGVSISAGGGSDTINNIGVQTEIYSGAGNDEIFTKGDSVIASAGAGNDSLENQDGSKISIDMGAGEDFVESFGDLNTINAGEDDDIINNIGDKNSLDAGNGDDYVENIGNSNTIKGGKGDDYILNIGDKNFVDGGAAQDYIVSAGDENTLNGGKGNDIIDLQDGSNTVIKYNSGDGDDIILGFGDTDSLDISGAEFSSVKSGEDILFTIGEGSILLKEAASSGEILFDESKSIKKVKLVGNSRNNSLVGGKKNDTLNGGRGNDTLTGGKGKDIFVYSAGKDVIADYSAQDKISVASAYENFSVSGSDLIFTFGKNNSLTVKNGAGKAVNLNSVVNFYTADGVFDKGKKSVTLSADTKNFSAKNYSNLATIDGSETNSASITGNSKGNFIRAGYSSTIAGGKGKDTIFGGDGSDIFIYNKGDGKDVIENYGEGDIISLGSGATIKDAKIKKGSSVFKIGSGSITVKDTSDVTLTSGGADTIFSNGIFIFKNMAEVPGSFVNPIDLGELGVRAANAALAKKKISINGSDSADSLVGGKAKDTLNGGAGADTLEGGKGNDILNGGAGDDSLWGGKGNDTLTGGDGDDIFIFRAGDGNDVITDYAAGDMLQILNKKGTGFVDYKKATFKNDTLTLSINGGGKIILKNISDSTSININGTSRTVSSMI